MTQYIRLSLETMQRHPYAGMEGREPFQLCAYLNTIRAANFPTMFIQKEPCCCPKRLELAPQPEEPSL